MRATTGAVAGLTAALLLGLHWVLPLAPATLVRNSAGIVCAAAIVVGVCRHRPARPAAWLLIATATLLLGVGDIAFSLYRYGPDPLPFPSWADAIFLAAYTTLAGGLWLVERRSKARDATAWQDAATWAVAGVLLGWEWLRQPLLETSGGSPAAVAAVAAYPLLDLVLLVLLVRLVASRVGSPRVRWGLALSVGAYLISDALFVMHAFPGGGKASATVGLGWLAFFVGLAATALHPSMVELGEPQTTPVRGRGDRRQLLLVGFALLSPALAAWHDWSTDGDDLALIVAGALTLLVLTSLRGAGLLRELARLTGELQGRERELQHRATRDALTGLSNRAVLQEEMDRRMAAGEPFSVALIDLDDFKHVNDARGHDAGDALLVSVAQCLLTGLMPDALVSRLGGDEFAVLADGAPEALAELLARCMHSCVEPHSEVHVRASVGVSSSLAGAATRSELLQHADLAMYVAKRAGGGRTRVYQPAMSTQLREEHDLRGRLVASVQAGEFAAWFQPVVALDTGRLTGFEALVRWERGDGPALPDDWMAIAEQSDVVVAVDLQVLGLAARQLVRWGRDVPGADGLGLAVNMSARSLREPDIVQRVLAIVEREGLAPGQLVLEVVEQVLREEAAGPRLQQLRAAGVRVALDHFGTGWSSLAHLRRFPVDVLKLDRSFLTGLGDGAAPDALAAAILQLAAALDLEVVAEGIETRDEADALLKLGCRSAQGFLFAHPAPAAQLTHLVRDGRLPVVPRPRLPQPQDAPVVLPLRRGAELDGAAG